MQSCLEETTALQSSTSVHYQPEQPSPSEPESEPMQVDSTVYLPLKDSVGCPRICVYTVDLEDIEPPHALFMRLVLWLIPLTTKLALIASDLVISVTAVLDSGSAGNFISGQLCRQLKL